MLAINDVYFDINNDVQGMKARERVRVLLVASLLFFRLYFANIFTSMSGRQGGKAKPLKKPKKEQKELTEVCRTLMTPIFKQIKIF